MRSRTVPAEKHLEQPVEEPRDVAARARPASAPTTHFRGLDGLRAVAALAVVGFHARIGGFTNGDIGVDVFFTLSGFLITSILLRSIASSGRVPYADFYRRRASRLLPAYLAVVAACVVAEVVVRAGGTFKGAVVSFFYVANWPVALGAGLGTLDHTWSLSIEEQFYLVWPIALVALVRGTRGDPRRLRRWIGAPIGLAFLCSIVLFIGHAPIAFITNATPTRALELLVGCLLATRAVPSTTVAPRRRAMSARAAGAAGLVALAALVVSMTLTIPSPRVNVLVMWPFTSLCTCAVIYAVVRGSFVNAVLGVAPLAAIGRVSYGLYLWHFPVLVLLDTEYGLGTWRIKIIGLALSAALTLASYVLIERPFLRRRSAPVDGAAPRGSQHRAATG